MEALYRKISTVAIILFAMGIIAVSYQLYTISSRVAETLGVHEAARLTQVSQVFQQTNWIVIAEIALGLLAIVMLLLGKQKVTQSAHLLFQTNEAISYQPDATDSSQAEVANRVQVIADLLESSHSTTKAALESVLLQVCRNLEACQGAFFQVTEKNQRRLLELSASYAYYFADSQTIAYEFGEGLTGQVAKDGKLVNIKSVPEGYLTIISGLGKSSPKHLAIVPVKQAEQVTGVMEIASFREISSSDERFLDEVARLIGMYMRTHTSVISEE